MPKITVDWKEIAEESLKDSIKANYNALDEYKKYLSTSYCSTGNGLNNEEFIEFIEKSSELLHT